MNDTFPHDTSGGAACANTVRGRSGSTVGTSGSHYIIGPLQKASGPRKKEKTAMSHFWDTHHTTWITEIVLELTQSWKSGSLQPVLVFGLDTVRCLSPILQDLRKPITRGDRRTTC